jgi:hypothetical protein
VVFGLYQALWLLGLLLTMVVAVRRSLLVNLGIFAGLLYNFVPLANFYFFPWDLPATVFLTSHVLEIVEKLCSHVGIIHQGKLVHQAPMEEIRQDGSLEHVFLKSVGSDQIERQTLSWLEG